ncbi:hypothetical protein GCM10023085_45250 [Actinomadura viridis]|uniref:Uncharacterized protein n=1 Tax=Actinomadura viridis TaxID=58110 RepID=A0A931GNU0_9ACTN|nr:hypothetical protein [Actinomadura viridis]MBG6089886.1 hypothetical protein [Actinomadura viridis]
MHCGKVVGPVWKLGGESWACSLERGHDGDHKASDGTWWVDGVCAPGELFVTGGRADGNG